MRDLLRRFRSDQRGNIALMSVGGIALAVCCAALAVDVGTISADRRKTQSTADISAIVAARDRKSTRLNSSHGLLSRMPSSA